MRNKTEQNKTYEISGFRWVREETSFTVEAKNDWDAQELAQDHIDNDECNWVHDWEAGTSEEGFDFEVVTPEKAKSA